jgi:hypothetical protein
MAVTSSRVEDARDAIIAELQNISTTNGYRTTPNQVINAIRPLDAVRTFPEIGVEIGDEVIVPKDDNRGVFDSEVDVHIVGICEANTDTGDDNDNLGDAAEALLHDIKRIVGSLTLQWVNRSPNRWHINRKRPIACFRVMGLGPRRTKGMVGVTFQIQIRAQDEQFADPTSTQVGELALEQGGDLLQESNQNVLLEQKV